MAVGGLLLRIEVHERERESLRRGRERRRDVGVGSLPQVPRAGHEEHVVMREDRGKEHGSAESSAKEQLARPLLGEEEQVFLWLEMREEGVARADELVVRPRRIDTRRLDEDYPVSCQQLAASPHHGRWILQVL